MKKRARVSVVIPALEDTVLGQRSTAGSEDRTAEVIIRERELKTVDVEIPFLPFDSDLSSTAYQTTVNGLAEGVNFYERVGSKVHWESIRFKFQFAFGDPRNASASYVPEGAAFRMVLLWDKYPGTTLAFNEVFGGVESDGSSFCTCLSFLQPEESGRFRILRDYTYHFPTVTAPVGSGTNHVLQTIIESDFINLKGLTSRYSQSDDLPSSISQGKLTFYFINRALNVGQTLSLLNASSTCRLRFRDG